MTTGLGRFLRGVAASLAWAYGIMLVATLWLRDLTELAVVDALIGAVYLTIGIGLFGRSRFSLFLGIIVPAASIAVVLATLQPIEQVYRLRVSVDATIAMLSLLALWQVRATPTD